ncbi:hypothetical protein M513_05764 [Trichuris suis]|uniref:Uncharacterized protein n=1 Tax=Trichuris suis TaxID=68888 RepID=A0A085M7T7_9BILA|nr:hypothetical protein M513_05764 [Trichuris suis]
MKGQNTDVIRDENWLQDLAFAVDITARLTDLNLKLQAPFTYDVTKAEESLQMELLKMQSDSTLRAKYLEVGYTPVEYVEYHKNGGKYQSRVLINVTSTPAAIPTDFANSQILDRVQRATLKAWEDFLLGCAWLGSSPVVTPECQGVSRRLHLQDPPAGATCLRRVFLPGKDVNICDVAGEPRRPLAKSPDGCRSPTCADM